MLRIDPLTESGTVDGEFFGSEEYAAHRNAVEKYLKDEGFEEITKPITIKLLDRLWSVRNTSKQSNP